MVKLLKTSERIDTDCFNNTEKDDLIWDDICLDEYNQVRRDIVEQCGHDDWEWD